jgi:hypothetical protein
LYGSLSGLTHVVELQQRRYIPHVVAPQAPASPPLLDELADPLLDPPEPDVLPPEPPLEELPFVPLLDELPLDVLEVVPLELPDPFPLLLLPPEELLDPPWPLLLPLEVLPDCPEELPPEPPLDPPPLVDDVVPSTDPSAGSRVNSVPPQRTPAITTASNAKYLRLPRFMLDP